MRELEHIISEQGFYVNTRLTKREESGHWVTSHPEHVVIDDVTTTSRDDQAISLIHPVFTKPDNNAVFHSLAEVTRVLTQLQVGRQRLNRGGFKVLKLFGVAFMTLADCRLVKLQLA